MPKGLWLILPAAFIDLISVFISWLCVVLGATAGTTGAAASAYAACSYVGAGSTVSSACAAAGAYLGTIVDPLVATVGIPLGIALGDAITVCLTIMGLSLLLMPMLMMGMFYPKYLFVDLGKLVPILNWVPFLSLFVIACIARRYMDDKKQTGGITSIAMSIGKVALAPESTAGAILGAATALNASKQRMANDIRPPAANDNLSHAKLVA